MTTSIPSVETVKEPKVEGKKANDAAESEDNRSGSTTKSQRVTGIGLGNIFSGQPIQLKQTSLKEVIKDVSFCTRSLRVFMFSNILNHQPFHQLFLIYRKLE
ncbi:unnamed protein product [Echinostoma caproni]|uniref:Uncharacterized protein n=1 Tax=Echinostoma caproni TaxID=27848 RepID=A0A183B7R3_9TREM|nr:unnamed protein product [Echinostoma caproni]